MKKTIVLILLLIPMLCFAGSLQEKHRSVIAKKNVVSGGTTTEEWGYTTQAGTSYSGVSNVITCVGPYTPPHTGSIKKFHLYSSNTDGNADFTVGVYTNNSNAPSALVGSETEFLNVGTWSLGWKEFSPTTVSVSSGSSYFLCFDKSVASELTFYYDGSQTGIHWASKDSFEYGTSWTDPFGSTTGNLDGYAFSYKVTVEY